MERTEEEKRRLPFSTKNSTPQWPCRSPPLAIQAPLSQAHPPMQCPSPWCPAGPGTLQLLLPCPQSVPGLPAPHGRRLPVVPERLRQVPLHAQALLVANAHVEPALGILAQQSHSKGNRDSLAPSSEFTALSLVTLLSLLLHPLGSIFSSLVLWREA